MAQGDFGDGVQKTREGLAERASARLGEFKENVGRIIEGLRLKKEDRKKELLDKVSAMADADVAKLADVSQPLDKVLEGFRKSSSGTVLALEVERVLESKQKKIQEAVREFRQGLLKLMEESLLPTRIEAVKEDENKDEVVNEKVIIQRDPEEEKLNDLIGDLDHTKKPAAFEALSDAVSDVDRAWRAYSSADGASAEEKKEMYISAFKALKDRFAEYEAAPEVVVEKESAQARLAKVKSSLAEVNIELIKAKGKSLAKEADELTAKKRSLMELRHQLEQEMEDEGKNAVVAKPATDSGSTFVSKPDMDGKFSPDMSGMLKKTAKEVLGKFDDKITSLAEKLAVLGDLNSSEARKLKAELSVQRQNRLEALGKYVGMGLTQRDLGVSVKDMERVKAMSDELAEVEARDREAQEAAEEQRKAMELAAQLEVDASPRGRLSKVKEEKRLVELELGKVKRRLLRLTPEEVQLLEEKRNELSREIESIVKEIFIAEGPKNATRPTTGEIPSVVKTEPTSGQDAVVEPKQDILSATSPKDALQMIKALEARRERVTVHDDGMKKLVQWYEGLLALEGKVEAASAEDKDAALEAIRACLDKRPGKSIDLMQKDYTKYQKALDEKLNELNTELNDVDGKPPIKLARAQKKFEDAQASYQTFKAQNEIIKTIVDASNAIKQKYDLAAANVIPNIVPTSATVVETDEGPDVRLEEGTEELDASTGEVVAPTLDSLDKTESIPYKSAGAVLGEMRDEIIKLQKDRVMQSKETGEIDHLVQWFNELAELQTKAEQPGILKTVEARGAVEAHFQKMPKVQIAIESLLTALGRLEKATEAKIADSAQINRRPQDRKWLKTLKAQIAILSGMKGAIELCQEEYEPKMVGRGPKKVEQVAHVGGANLEKGIVLHSSVTDRVKVDDMTPRVDDAVYADGSVVDSEPVAPTLDDEPNAREYRKTSTASASPTPEADAVTVDIPPSTVSLDIDPGTDPSHVESVSDAADAARVGTTTVNVDPVVNKPRPPVRPADSPRRPPPLPPPNAQPLETKFAQPGLFRAEDKSVIDKWLKQQGPRLERAREMYGDESLAKAREKNESFSQHFLLYNAIVEATRRLTTAKTEAERLAQEDTLITLRQRSLGSIGAEQALSGLEQEQSEVASEIKYYTEHPPESPKYKTEFEKLQKRANELENEIKIAELDVELERALMEVAVIEHTEYEKSPLTIEERIQETGKRIATEEKGKDWYTVHQEATKAQADLIAGMENRNLNRESEAVLGPILDAFVQEQELAMDFNESLRRFNVLAQTETRVTQALRALDRAGHGQITPEVWDIIPASVKTFLKTQGEDETSTIENIKARLYERLRTITQDKVSTDRSLQANVKLIEEMRKNAPYERSSKAHKRLADEIEELTGASRDTKNELERLLAAKGGKAGERIYNATRAQELTARAELIQVQLKHKVALMQDVDALQILSTQHTLLGPELEETQAYKALRGQPKVTEGVLAVINRQKDTKSSQNLFTRRAAEIRSTLPTTPAIQAGSESFGPGGSSANPTSGGGESKPAKGFWASMKETTFGKGVTDLLSAFGIGGGK